MAVLFFQTKPNRAALVWDPLLMACLVTGDPHGMMWDQKVPVLDW